MIITAPLQHQRALTGWMLALLFCCWVLLASRGALAQTAPAHFWISESNQSTGPEAPSVYLPLGPNPVPRTFYIWGQPDMNLGSTFNTLQNISLNLVDLSAQPLVDIIDTFQINEAAGARFQIIGDSDGAQLPGPAGHPTISFNAPNFVRSSVPNGSTIGPGTADKVLGLVAGNADTSVYSGIGLINQPGDNSLSGNSRAWLIGSFQVESTNANGTSELYLQIGSYGMSGTTSDGQSEYSGSINVVFGRSTDRSYNAGSDRQTTDLALDSPDLIITAKQQLVRGDLNLDGNVDGKDISTMLQALADVNDFQSRESLSTNDLLTIADFDGDGKFTNADLQGLLKKLITSSNGAQAVPEPNCCTLALSAIGVLASCFSDRLIRLVAAGATELVCTFCAICLAATCSNVCSEPLKSSGIVNSPWKI
jgi:Dockerin type I domain